MASFNPNKDPDLNRILIHDFSTSRSLNLNNNTLRKQKDYVQITRLNSIYPDKTITIEGVDYLPTEFYFMGKIHNISGLKQAGEIVIKHTHSNESELYLYLPVMVDPIAESTPISNLISSVAEFNKDDDTTQPFNFARVIDKQKNAFYYKTDNIISVVFTAPLFVPEYPDTLRGVPEFMKAPNAKEYSIIPLNLTNDEQIYIDCNPTGESADTIAAYNIPINSEYSKISANSMFERHATFSGMYLIALIGVYMIVPYFYRTYIVESTILWGKDEKTRNTICPANEKDSFIECIHKRIAESNSIIWYIFVAIIMLHFSEGLIEKNSTQLAISMYIFIGFVAAVMSIMTRGSNPQFYFYKGEQLYPPQETEYANFNWLPASILPSWLKIMAHPENFTGQGIRWYVIALLIAVSLLTVLLTLPLTGTVKTGMSIRGNVFSGILYTTAITAFLTTVFNREPEAFKINQDLGFSK